MIRTTHKTVFLLTIALLASLGVNVFLGGILAGRSMNAPTPPPWVEKDHRLRQLLPEADRAILRDMMQAQRATLQQMKDDLATARDNVRDATQGGDDAALDLALQDEKDAKEALLRQIQNTRAAAMEKLSPEGREALKQMGLSVRRRFQKHFGIEPDFIPDIAGPDDIDFDLWWPEEE